MGSFGFGRIHYQILSSRVPRGRRPERESIDPRVPQTSDRSRRSNSRLHEKPRQFVALAKEELCIAECKTNAENECAVTDLARGLPIRTVDRRHGLARDAVNHSLWA